MSTYFNKFERLVAVAILAGVMVPQVAAAKGKKSGSFQGNPSQMLRSTSNTTPQITRFRNLQSQPTGSPSIPLSGQMKSIAAPKLLSGTRTSQFNNSLFNSANTPTTTVGGNNRPLVPIVNQNVWTGPITQPIGRISDSLLPTGRDSVVDPVRPPFVFTGPVVGPLHPVVDTGTTNPSPDAPVDSGPRDSLPDDPFDVFRPGPRNPSPDDPVDPPAPPADPPADPPAPPAPPVDPPATPADPPQTPPSDSTFPWPIVVPIFQGGNSGGTYSPTPAYPSDPTVPAQPIVETQPGGSVDLVLEDLRYVEPATLLVGPAYRVKFRNQSLEAIGKFRVALLASMDGKPNKDLPRAIVEVDGMAAGQAGELTIRLPKSAMQMVSTTGQPASFRYLLVGVDLDGAISELDKTNNVAIVERAQLEAAAR